MPKIQGISRTVLLNLLLAAAYALTGLLALATAISPGVTAVLFPPAGIALAAVLLGGARLLPGIYAGSLLIQIAANNNAHLPLELTHLLVVPAGATLQAIAGAWLARRCDVWPGGMDSQRAITGLILLVAPFSCLISATLAAVARQGSIGSDLFNWANWWAGDLLGVLIFTPITLALIGRPREHWGGRRITLALPLLGACVAFTGALMLVRQREEVRIHSDFLRDAEHVATLLQGSLQTRLDVILSLERYAALTPEFSEADWYQLTRPWLERHPGILNLTWDPRVPRDHIEAFEARQREAGRPDFTVRDRDAHGHFAPRGNREAFYPITYIAPLAGNEPILGMDPASTSASNTALQRTLRSGVPSATPPLPLAQLADKGLGVVIYQAVFASSDTARQHPLGVVSSAMHISDIVSSAARQYDRDAIALCIVEPGNLPSAPARLFGPAGCDQPGWMSPSTSVSIPVRFADRHWELMLRDEDGLDSGSRSWIAGTALAVTVLFSGLLTTFLLLLSGRERRTAALVEQRTAELAITSRDLHEQQFLLAQAQRLAMIGSWKVDAPGASMQCSQEMRRQLELSDSAPFTRSDLIASMVEEDRPPLQAAFEELGRAPGSRNLDCRRIDHDGTLRILHFHIEHEPSAGGSARFIGTMQDVTGQREAQAHIEHLAHFDPLTGLANRAHWRNQASIMLEAATRHGDNVAALFLDLDHFKTINDTLGHQVGDLLLAAASQRLRNVLRTEDLIGRQGGDEFVILIQRLRGPEEAARIAAKLVRSLSSPFDIESRELMITVSVGIACFPQDAHDADALLKYADLAMYSAKESGRNNFRFFAADMTTRAMQRLQFEQALRIGIERNQMRLHYQPLMSLSGKQILGCEALVRWQHPERGMVPPSDFIPLAEETGLILQLGEWVMREACRQQASWARSGLKLKMSINIAAPQVQQGDFVDTVGRILHETGARAQDIELEITEGSLIDCNEVLIERLRALRNMGLTLALDDFGTGYSSLAYLKRLPIRRLKIDRSFVTDLPGDTEDAAIASATLSIARDLGLEVTAEGVENEAQLDWLERRGCTTVQGYFISRPLPAEALHSWLGQTQAC